VVLGRPHHRTPASVCQIQPCLTIRILQRSLGGSETRPYLDFAPTLTDRGQIKPVIEADPGVRAQEARLREAFAGWWQAHEPLLAGLAGSNSLTAVRARLLVSFAEALRPIGLLDRFQVDGVIASWWNASQYDLRTLASQGFEGLVDSWAATVRAALEDEEARANGFDPLAHKLVARLLPDYVAEVAAAADRVAGLQGRLKAAEPPEAEEGAEAEVEPDEPPGEAELKALKAELREARKTLKALQAQLLQRLDWARLALTPEACQRLVLDIARAELAAELERYVAGHRAQVVAAVENWWDKYRVPLREIEAERERSAEKINLFAQELGYA
jgi:type I restriction enzyme M protein